MIIAARLISSSSVALSVSIGYARSGGCRGGGPRSNSPDDDIFDSRRVVSSSPLPHLVQIFIAAVRGSRNPAWLSPPVVAGRRISFVLP